MTMGCDNPLISFAAVNGGMRVAFHTFLNYLSNSNEIGRSFSSAAISYLITNESRQSSQEQKDEERVKDEISFWFIHSHRIIYHEFSLAQQLSRLCQAFNRAWLAVHWSSTSASSMKHCFKLQKKIKCYNIIPTVSTGRTNRKMYGKLWNPNKTK